MAPNIDGLFHALGDPTRRAIVDRLAAGPSSISRLAQPLGITITAVAQHLQVLERCGIVQTNKLERVRTAMLLPGGLTPVERWVRDRRSVLERQLDQLRDVVDEH